jgi:hypothetical protein
VHSDEPSPLCLAYASRSAGASSNGSIQRLSPTALRRLSPAAAPRDVPDGPL